MSDEHPAYTAIYAVVRHIPPGRVSSYGRVAILAGFPGHARMVGYALHSLRTNQDVPWWRVVNARGFISNIYQRDEQRARLQAEGVVVDARDHINLHEYGWEALITPET
ncbi:methylated-DNA-(protein)-cysteine S-methyltransferase DNA binding [Oscillochloris trichoides DG-6]|uniref:Methylated-DNA-(Protein)-cysteine S-methyltransferase DNA binding n=1 Tax=Oscillochloris trichoides DG-6 TaxID=765420 RepID=E1IH52_9CHLR|nr:MGMT family protein [Oscillochloris trichoides]EFO79527.1 methylated-DNA-(protein)-cysteine S-methyltransferase DNA binding [Oscillochloris trichoides DG-6]